MTLLTPRKFDSEAPLSSKRSKSSALMPLTWQLGILVGGTVGAAAVDAPGWLLISLAALVGASTVATWRAYFRLLRTNPDALRSDKSQVLPVAADDASGHGAIAGATPPGVPPELPGSDT
jgi:hypothetical protein